MRQMRNVVVHVYFAVEPVIVWQTIQDNLPGLRSQLAAILGARPTSPDDEKQG